MAKEKSGNSETYKVRSEILSTGYFAKIDGADVLIKPGETEIAGLTDEQLRQMVIAGVIELTSEQEEAYRKKFFK